MSSLIENNSEIFEFDDFKLVRTGVPGDGSCFIHSILYNQSHKFRKSTIQDKIQIVNEFRNNLSDTIKLEEFLKINNGELAKLYFFKTFRENIQKWYQLRDSNMYSLSDLNQVSHYDKDTIKNIYSIIFDIITFDIFEKEFESLTGMKNIYFLMSKLNSKLENILQINMPKQIGNNANSIAYNKKIDKIIQIFNISFENLFQISLNQCYDNYREKLKNSQEWIGQEYIQLFENLFDINIYIIDFSTKELYSFGKNINRDHSKNVIVLYVDDCHFESVGLINETNKVKRLFSNDDNIIKFFQSVENIKS